jgi:nicotinamidase-related amidase
MQALLIIDIQNDYFPGGANPLVGSNEAVICTKNILNWFRDKGWPVIHIQHVANREGATFFLPGTKGAEIHETLRLQQNEKVIVKHYPNSFRETGLQDHLNGLAIKDLVVCGMMTHMCVDATVRAAKDFGFNITLISNACATKDLVFRDKAVSATDVHNAFLAALNYFYAEVKTMEEFLG